MKLNGEFVSNNSIASIGFLILSMLVISSCSGPDHATPESVTDDEVEASTALPGDPEPALGVDPEDPEDATTPEPNDITTLDDLDSEDPAARRAACLSLEASGTVAAEHVSVLIGRLSDSNVEFARCAARVAGMAGQPAVPELVHAMKTSSKSVRRLIVDHAIPALPPEADPVQELEAILKDTGEPDETRATAAEALGRLSHRAKDGIPALVTALGDSRPRVAVAASQALGSVGRPAVRPLLKALMSDDARVRSFATGAIQGIEPPPSEAVPILASMARNDPSVKVRMSARLALEDFDTPEAKKALAESGGATPFGRR